MLFEKIFLEALEEHKFQLGDEVVYRDSLEEIKGYNWFPGVGKVVSTLNAREYCIVRARDPDVTNTRVRLSRTRHAQAREGDFIDWNKNWFIVGETFRPALEGLPITELYPCKDYYILESNLQLSPEAQNKKDIEGKYGKELEDI